MPHSARQIPTPEQDLDIAIADHRAGRLAAAEDGYRRVLEAYPAHPDALHLMGLLACDRGQPDEALQWVDAAIARAHERAAFHNTRGRALSLLGMPAEAERAYRAAWALRPDSAEIANNLACLLRDRDDGLGAVEWFWKASALAPGSADIAVNLALALQSNGALAASLMQFQHALLLRPNCADTLYQLGHLQLEIGQPAAAERSFRLALSRRPNHAGCTNNLGIALERQGRNEAAAQCFADALRCDPNNADAHYNLGCMLLLDNRAEEARAHHDRAIRLEPLHGKAHWARCMAELPMLYDRPEQIAPARARYADALHALAGATDPALRRALAQSVGSSQPFFLPYQGAIDRALQADWGRLVGDLVPADPTIELAGAPEVGERIRLAIVCGQVCEHTVWRLMLLGWLTHIDRHRFSVTLYNCGLVQDPQTGIARELADGYVQGGLGTLRRALLADRPHAVIYPELGMDPVCARLAVERFAPVQCVAWGQPQTSGLASIDLFLSSDAMEPADAASHYTERLVRLPGLGVVPVLQRTAPLQRLRSTFGLETDSVAFWCGQALYKYLPQHDAVFTRIAAARPDSQFLFIGFAKSRIATAQFRARLARGFAAAGLDAEAHCVFVDSMDQALFRASAAACDIVLDSIGWSGGKSTLDLLGEGRPVVTVEGGLMRGRHTAAILRCLGITATIADSVDGYVEIALRLAADPAARDALGAHAQAGLGRLLEDLSPVRGARRGAEPGDQESGLGGWQVE